MRASLLCLLLSVSLVSPALAEPKDKAIDPTDWGRVIGHVYAARAGTPLAGAAVSIQQEGEFAAAGRAQPYSVRVLGPLGGCACEAHGLNNAVQVAGLADSATGVHRRRYSMNRNLPLFLSVFTVAALPLPTRAETASAPSPDAQSMRVAILPVLEKSGREGKEKEQFIEAATSALRDGFRKEGLSVVDPGEIDAAARELQIDAADPDQRTREPLSRLASRLGARFVATAAIIEVDSKMKIGFFVSRKQGTATVELAVFDAQSGAYTTRSSYRATKSSSAWAPGLSSARNKRTGAIAAAIGKGIKEFVTRLGTRPRSSGKG